MISRVFIFYTAFYSITALLIILIGFAIPIDPNCANKEIQQSVAPSERPSLWDFTGKAWDLVINVATLGVGTRCDTPFFVSMTIGLFNLMSLSILGVGIAFFIRGSS